MGQGRVAALKPPGGREADALLEDIDLRGLDRGKTVDPRDLRHERSRAAHGLCLSDVSRLDLT
jgi:hypothetical protein